MEIEMWFGTNPGFIEVIFSVLWWFEATILWSLFCVIVLVQGIVLQEKKQILAILVQWVNGTLCLISKRQKSSTRIFNVELFAVTFFFLKAMSCNWQLFIKNYEMIFKKGTYFIELLLVPLPFNFQLLKRYLDYFTCNMTSP